MFIRRLCGLLLTLLVLVSGAAAADDPVLQEEIYGPEALLYCVESGQTLYEKNADTPVPPASVTKLMTALVVLEHEPDLSRTTTVSQTAVDIERDSTHIALVLGEQVTLQDMMYATLMQSANDAANVLAEAVGGTQAEFAEMMNERAAQLGCTGSHFENAHGLDADGHLVTARDMARITAALLDDPRFVQIAGALTYTMPANNKQSEARTFYTKQRMLRADSAFYNPYAIAGKNGYTTKAQHTQCMVARKDGLTWIAVSLGSSGNMYYPWRDMRTLFAYALNGFQAVTLSPEQVAALAEQAGAAQPDRSACPSVTLALPLDASMDDLRLSQTADAAGLRTLELTRNGQIQPWCVLPQPLATDLAPADQPTNTDPVAQPDNPAQVVPWFLAGLGAVAVFAVWSALAMRRARKIRRQRDRRRRRRAARRRDDMP